MSVLIKGMKMPTSCLKGGCPLDGFACELWEDKYWASYKDPEKGRHRDCPLIPVPDPVKHGKWIADKYTRKCSECGSTYWMREGNAWNYCPNCGARNGGEG